MKILSPTLCRRLHLTPDEHQMSSGWGWERVLTKLIKSRHTSHLLQIIGGFLTNEWRRFIYFSKMFVQPNVSTCWNVHWLSSKIYQTSKITFIRRRDTMSKNTLQCNLRYGKWNNHKIKCWWEDYVSILCQLFLPETDTTCPKMENIARLKLLILNTWYHLQFSFNVSIHHLSTRSNISQHRHRNQAIELRKHFQKKILSQNQLSKDIQSAYSRTLSIG